MPQRTAAVLAVAIALIAAPIASLAESGDVPLTAAGGPAYIPPLDGDVTLRPLPQDRLDAIWRWVAEYGGFDADAYRPPIIVYASRHTLQRLAFGEEGYWFLRDRIAEDHAELGYSINRLSDGHGAGYDEGTMYLPVDADWSSGDLDFVIAHEFVHHWQWLRGDWGKHHCRAMLEPEAYRAQNAFSEIYGGEIVDAGHVRQVLMACSGD